MNESIGIIGVAAFAANGIDDLFVLMLFFSALHVKPGAVVLDQFIGIATLVAISALGALLTLVLPSNMIGSE